MPLYQTSQFTVRDKYPVARRTREIGLRAALWRRPRGVCSQVFLRVPWRSSAADGPWRPLHATPPHPEYPSGHTSSSSAMVTVLLQVLGDDPGVQLHLTFFGATRQWQTFEEAMNEVIEARIYSGIHFRTADAVGAGSVVRSPSLS